jgi:hypothetical protein
VEESNNRHRRLLPARGERPCSQHTERTEKFAPLHVRPHAQEKA